MLWERDQTWRSVPCREAVTVLTLWERGILCRGIVQGPLSEVHLILCCVTWLQNCEQIEPKKLPNPHKESKQHVRLNKEIKLNSAL